MKKKMFSLLMSLLMVISILPISNMTVYAEDENVDSNNIEVTTIYEEEFDDTMIIQEEEEDHNEDSLDLTIEVNQEDTAIEIEETIEVEDTTKVEQETTTNQDITETKETDISSLSDNNNDNNDNDNNNETILIEDNTTTNSIEEDIQEQITESIEQQTEEQQQSQEQLLNETPVTETTSIKKAPLRAPAAGSAEVHIGGSYEDDANDGSSRENAVATLDKAIELLQGEGTVIVEGPLYPGSNEYDFGNKDKVLIKRSASFSDSVAMFKGTTNLKNVTIDVEENTVVIFDPGFWTENRVTINNVDIKNAGGNGVIKLYGCFLDIYGDSVFENNINTSSGGGFAFAQYSTIIIHDGANVTFKENGSAYNGGAIYSQNSNLYIQDDATVNFNGNYSANGGAIYFEDDIYRTFKLGGKLSFDGNASWGSGGAIYVQGNVESIKISGASFAGNASNVSGGAIAIANDTAISDGGKLIIEDSNFTGNGCGDKTANPPTGVGGAVFIGWGTYDISIANSTFRDNEVVLKGGAVAIHGDTNKRHKLSIEGSTFENNTSDERGGAVFHQWPSQDGGVEINDSTFTSNKTTSQGGGAVAVYSGIHYNSETLKDVPVTVKNSTFTENEAKERGGALEAWDAAECGIAVTITDSTFTENKAGLYGGAVFLPRLGSGAIERSTFERNEVSTAVKRASNTISTDKNYKEDCPTGSGGAIFQESKTKYVVTDTPDFSLIVNESIFKENKAVRGGAISLYRTGSLMVFKSEFEGNDADSSVLSNPEQIMTYENGGAIAYRAQSKDSVTIADTTFKDNQAGYYGGAVYIRGSNGLDIMDAFLLNDTFENNHAYVGGGASLESSNLVLDGDPVFNGNEADYVGGGLFIDSADSYDRVNVDIISVTLKNNKAAYLGGGMSLGGFWYDTLNVIATMKQAEITGNQVTAGEVDAGGGGIYVHNDAILYMKDVAVYGNEATNVGGGIYTCPNGAVIRYDIHGGAIFDNEAGDLSANDYASANVLESALLESMLGGGVHNWETLTKEITLTTYKTNNYGYVEYDSNGNPVTETKTYRVTYAKDDPHMMESDLVQLMTAQEAAIANAKIKIYGNSSTAGTSAEGIAEMNLRAGGGGMAVNGTVVIGEPNGILLAIAKTGKDRTPLAGAEFTITEVNKNGAPGITMRGYTDEDGTILFMGIRDGEYILSETKAPEGFKADHKVFYLSVSDEVVTIKDEEGNSYDIITGNVENSFPSLSLLYEKFSEVVISNTVADEEKIELKVAKNWHVDENTLADGLIFPVRLYWGPDEDTQYDTGTTVWLSASNGWKASLGKWPKYWDKDQTKETVYSIVEVGDNGKGATNTVMLLETKYDVSYENTATPVDARDENREEKLVVHNGPRILDQRRKDLG